MKRWGLSCDGEGRALVCGIRAIKQARTGSKATPTGSPGPQQISGLPLPSSKASQPPQLWEPNVGKPAVHGVFVMAARVG